MNNKIIQIFCISVPTNRDKCSFVVVKIRITTEGTVNFVRFFYNDSTCKVLEMFLRNWHENIECKGL